MEWPSWRRGAHVDSFPLLLMRLPPRRCLARKPAACWCEECRDLSGWSKGGASLWSVVRPIDNWRINALSHQIGCHAGLLRALGESATEFSHHSFDAAIVVARVENVITDDEVDVLRRVQHLANQARHARLCVPR